jgi:long-chain acyl-CoA synthetase
MRGQYPFYPVEPITDLKGLLEKSVQRFAKKTALLWKEQGQWRSLSYRELYQNVESLAAGMNALGLQPGDKVAILGENRPEWAMTYLAVMCSGLTGLPIDKDLRSQEIFHLLHLCEAKLIVASEKYLDDLLSMQPRLPSLERIIVMDQDPKSKIQNPKSSVEPFSSLLDKGRRAVKRGDKTFRQKTIAPHTLAVIIFSSGTMGNPKGVMLSHRNIATNVMQTTKSVYVDDKDRFLSVLPLHHTYECTAGFLVPLYRGSSIAYAENLRRVAENMAEVQATVMLGVPLLYEAFYNRLRAAIKEKGEAKFEKGRKIANLSEKLLGLNVRRRIFSQVHNRFGGHVRLFISGGAPLPAAVARFFRELGINFIQGYGLTEASPLVAVNRDKAFKDDSVGFIMDQMEAKIVDGVLWVKGENVMQGYYRNPQATADVLQEGWLNTGDLAAFDEDGFLHIQGRQKAVIVTPNGKNISPEEVEMELLKSPYIQEVLVWGGPNPQDAEVQAIVVPHIEQLTVDFGSQGVVLAREKMEEIIRQEINECCKNLAAYKRVSKFTLREEEFAKTTTRKIKRYLYTETSKPVSAQGEK